MTIRTIPQLIKVIEDYEICDIIKINSMCDALFSKVFLPIQFGNNSRDKYYYIHHLRDFARDFDKNIIERPFIDMQSPFNIKDIFN